MPIQRKNLFLTWGIRISLVPVILVLLALGLIAIVLFAICGVCGRFLAALGGLAALLALFDKCYQEAAVSAIVAFLLSPYGAPQVLFWLGRKLLEFTDWRNLLYEKMSVIHSFSYGVTLRLRTADR